VTATPPIQRGDVIRIFDYEFEDGTTTANSKYFVVMGFRIGYAYGFLTTSKEKGGRVRKEGCKTSLSHYPSSYYLLSKTGALAPATWIVLRAETHELESLVKKLAVGKAERVLTLADTVRSALRNCFEKSSDWAPILDEVM
jgi:hypothetical protein